MRTRGEPEEDHMLTAPVRSASQIGCPAEFLYSPGTAAISHHFPRSVAPSTDDTTLVVRLSVESESDWRRVTARRCSASGARWVDLVIDPACGVRLGPLSHRDWPVCGHCADRRIEGARAEPASPGDPIAAEVTDHLAHLAALLLEREIDRLSIDLTGTGERRQHVVSLDTEATRLSVHRVIGLPDCTMCAGPGDPSTPTTLDTDDVPALLTQLEGWLDPLTGVVPQLRLEQPFGELPGLPVIATAAAPQLVSSTGRLELPIGWGKGLDPAAAVISATGEAIERYAASLPDDRKLVWCRADELPGDVLDPGFFALYSDEQYRRPGFPFVRYDPSLPHPWILGRWYGADDPVWVPAVLCHLRLRLRPHQMVVQGSSNGLAAGGSVDDAADRAVLELLERDAFLTAWRTGNAARRLDSSTIDDRFRPTLEALRGFGLTVDLGLIEGAFGVSTVVALGRGDGLTTPGACIGLASSPDPAVAGGRAILELAQTVPHLTGLMASGLLPSPRSEQDVTSMLDHAAYFFPTERCRPFDRLFRSDPALSLHRPTDVGSSDVAATLRQQGIRVAVVDLTTPDVATGPFRVVRAVSPDLMALTFGGGLDRLPPARVAAMPVTGPVPALHPVW
jgi:ribosomal protein S12 methylthiotransferase accessory factor